MRWRAAFLILPYTSETTGTCVHTCKWLHFRQICSMWLYRLCPLCLPREVKRKTRNEPLVSSESCESFPWFAVAEAGSGCRLLPNSRAAANCGWTGLKCLKPRPSFLHKRQFVSMWGIEDLLNESYQSVVLRPALDSESVDNSLTLTLVLSIPAWLSSNTKKQPSTTLGLFCTFMDIKAHIVQINFLSYMTIRCFILLLSMPKLQSIFNSSTTQDQNSRSKVCEWSDSCQSFGFASEL